MPSRKDIESFVESQQSIHLYNKVKKALRDVLLAMPDADYKKSTENLILMALHEGAIAQAMHFSRRTKFKILQLTIPNKVPISVLKYIIAHELGHVMQERNWNKRDGMKLEIGAEEYSKKIGFPRTNFIDKWIKRYRRRFGLKY